MSIIKQNPVYRVNGNVIDFPVFIKAELDTNSANYVIYADFYSNNEPITQLDNNNSIQNHDRK